MFIYNQHYFFVHIVKYCDKESACFFNFLVVIVLLAVFIPIPIS